MSQNQRSRGSSKSLKSKLANATGGKGEEAALRKQLKAAHKQIEQLHERYDRLKSTKWTIPTAGKSKTPKGCFTRAFITDTHGAKADTKALSAVFSDMEVLQPSEVVFGGDHIDCGGFLAQHWTMGFVAETGHTHEDDLNATNHFLDKVQEICPNANFHYLLGNHESRIEKWCVTQALKDGKDASYLLSRLAPWVELHLDKRGIPHYRQSVCYHGLRVRGAIKLGKCHFTHGRRTGVNATRKTLQDFGGNVVHGHTHTAGHASDVTVTEGAIGGWCPGCLCDLQPYWQHKTDVNNWSHGYAVQLVRPNGEFLHINVPIIDGRSFLIQMQEAVSK